jgi:hypothetical protein
VLLAKAAGGCRVLVEDPDRAVEALLGVDGIELHAFAGGEDWGLYRADGQMLRRIGVLSEPPPVMLLERRTSHGLFDRLADEFEECWEQTLLPNRERLIAYRAEVELESLV